MEALILSCGIGGGHDAAGRAVAEALERRGHRVTFMDPYQLAGEGAAERGRLQAMAAAQARAVSPHAAEAVCDCMEQAVENPEQERAS